MDLGRRCQAVWRCLLCESLDLKRKRCAEVETSCVARTVWKVAVQRPKARGKVHQMNTLPPRIDRERTEDSKLFAPTIQPMTE